MNVGPVGGPGQMWRRRGRQCTLIITPAVSQDTLIHLTTSVSQRGHGPPITFSVYIVIVVTTTATILGFSFFFTSQPGKGTR